MDHRATSEAHQVNATRDDVLRYVGGSISPEMEIPKLLWLKRYLPLTYRSAGHFFDLADYLSFRATGSTVRSICTLVCKWNFLAHEQRWSESYFERIGLGDLASDDYAKIGKEIVAPGTPLGAGLTESAALDFGLLQGTPVGASLIDAHAGGVGTIGGREKSAEPVDVCRRLAYIMGTSACIMATTPKPCFVPGVWGPYYSGMVPGFWLNEGGQSAAGAAIDHLIRSHPAYSEAVATARTGGIEVLEFLERRIVARAKNLGEAALLARDIHVLPEFLGNRSPFADPDSRAVVAGMDLDTDIGSMERLFVAGLCGLAYGLADVVEAFRSLGVDSDLMVISGGAGKSSLVRQIMADTTGLTVAVPETQEPVLLGAAMLGAVAGRCCGSIGEAMASMSGIGRLTEATAPGMADFHRAKRRVHGLMRKLDRESRDVMRSDRSPGLRRRASAMLLSCGDALVDFLPVKSVDGRDAAVPVAGGSCLNIAVGMARLGAPAGFVGGISTDLFGRMITDHALDSQVELRYVTRSAHQTTLAFVRYVGGEPQYAFYDEATASRNWTYGRGSIPFDEIEAIHVGSTTLANAQGAAQTLAMIEDAGRSTTISFDPNCRPNLVGDKARYVDQMDAFAAAADIVRMSDVDFEFLYGGGDYGERAKSLIAAGTSLVVVTRGIKGAQAWHRAAGPVKVEAPTIDVVDTIGAGDSFQAALLFALRAVGRIKRGRAGANECRRASSGAVVCDGLCGLHMQPRRRRSSAPLRCRPGIVSPFCRIGTNQTGVPPA